MPTKNVCFPSLRRTKQNFVQQWILTGLVSSITSLKVNLDDPSYLYKPSKAVLKKAKHATKQYNQLHSCSAEVFKGRNALNKHSEDNPLDTNNNQNNRVDSPLTSSKPPPTSTNPSPSPKSPSTSALTPLPSPASTVKLRDTHLKNLLNATQSASPEPVNSISTTRATDVPPSKTPSFVFTSCRFVGHVGRVDKNKNNQSKNRKRLTAGLSVPSDASKAKRQTSTERETVRLENQSKKSKNVTRKEQKTSERGRVGLGSPFTQQTLFEFQKQVKSQRSVRLPRTLFDIFL